MTDTAPVSPYRRGRLPVKPEGERLAIGWISSYMAEPFPTVTYPVDVTGGWTDWGMLGNGPDPSLTVNGGQPVGDCTFAARQHLRQAKAASEGETETWETSNQLVTEYLAYDGGQDLGANIADLLLTWYKAGKILAFAPVDISNVAECDGAMVAFHGLYVGVNLTDDADQLFGEGKPWTTANGEKPDTSDGHCIVKAKATTDADTWLTWGAEQSSTKGWTKACVEEGWVILTSDDQADAAGVNLDALVADIEALHGTGPVDPPTPAPTPTPSPTPPTVGLVLNIVNSATAGRIENAADEHAQTVDSWAERHFERYFREGIGGALERELDG